MSVQPQLEEVEPLNQMEEILEQLTLEGVEVELLVILVLVDLVVLV
jgi:hypothetical protein